MAFAGLQCNFTHSSQTHGMKSSEPLSLLTWSEFEPSDASHWIQQALKEIKGTTSLESFTWETAEGIAWQPAYHAPSTEVPEIQWIQVAQLHRQWATPAPMIRLNWHPNFLEEWKEALHRGVKAFQLFMPDALPQAALLQKSLHSFPWAEVPVFWCTSQPNELYHRISSFYPYPLKGGIPGLTQDKEGALFGRAWFSGVSLAASGAHAVHELAYLLHQWKAAPGISVLEFSLQTNFFLDIAKARALRYLAHRLADQEQLPMPLLIATFNPYYLTRQSADTNQLRCTTAALAAMVGGVDGYYLPAWNSQTRRALNIPLILEEEGYLDQVIDPSQGSYFIEKITWDLVKAVSDQLDALPENPTPEFWQELADRDHTYRLAKSPMLVGATHFRAAGEILPPTTIPLWDNAFTTKNLEAALVQDLS